MTHSITFTVPGRLKGKGRARSAFIKPKGGGPGFITNYTPADTRNAEAMVRSLAAAAMHDADGVVLAPFAGPVCLSVQIWLNPPASWSQAKKRQSAFVTGKPDADNIVKLVGDSLNGIVWRDDSQVAELTLTRRYRMTDGEAATITVSELRFAVDLLDAAE